MSQTAQDLGRCMATLTKHWKPSALATTRADARCGSNATVVRGAHRYCLRHDPARSFDAAAARLEKAGDARRAAIYRRLADEERALDPLPAMSDADLGFRRQG